MAYAIRSIKKGKGATEYAYPIKDEATFRALRSEPKQLELLAKAREGDEKAKKRLLAVMYQGHPNDDGTIAGSTRMARYFFFDIDDKEEAERVILEVVNNLEEYKPAMIERSVKQGAHLVFPRPWGKTILEAQCEMALRLHTELDVMNKNPNRKSFSTSASVDDLVYIDPALFNDTFNAEEWEREKVSLSSFI